jgi:hypothetical protein
VSPRKQQFNTRLDTDEAGQVEKYAETHDITEAEATRRFIRKGIRSEQARTDGGPVTTNEFREAMREQKQQRRKTTRIQNASVLTGVVYLGAVAGDLLVGQEAIAGGLIVLAVLVASLVFVGDVDE